MELRHFPVLAAAFLVAGCGGGGDQAKISDDSPAPPETVQEEEIDEGDVADEVRLTELNDSGVMGTVRITSKPDADLQIVVRLADTATHAVAGAMGGCDDAGDEESLLGSATSFEFPDIEQGRMETAIDPVKEFVKDGEYSLVIYDGEDLDTEPIACAEVRIK
ncbi:MAG: hypothetical protein JWM90_3013 [Thermoleophilia bacterium]|nr:hypothetical protein [Thermoleophilia bacterium]